MELKIPKYLCSKVLFCLFCDHTKLYEKKRKIHENFEYLANFEISLILLYPIWLWFSLIPNNGLPAENLFDKHFGLCFKMMKRLLFIDGISWIMCGKEGKKKIHKVFFIFWWFTVFLLALGYYFRMSTPSGNGSHKYLNFLKKWKDKRIFIELRDGGI